MPRDTKRVTVNLPKDALESAMETTGKGITETLVAGLRELEKSQKRLALRALRGRIRLKLDLEKTRR